MGILKKIRDKTGTVHDLGDSRVDAFETELSGAARNVPYSPAVLGKANAIEKKIDDHAANVANPHGVTKEQLGLANVENKSSTQIRSEITKENVTNALGYTPIDESRIGAANGVASLDAGGRIPASQIPGGFDNIEEYDSLADFPETGEEGKIYVAKDTNLTYRWTGSQYVEISPSLALGETATTAYRGDRGKAAYDHSQISGDSTIHHTHANKELLDSYTQTEADLANAVAKVHEHGNKSVLDGITAEKVSAWDSKMDKQTVGSESSPVYLENGIAKECGTLSGHVLSSSTGVPGVYKIFSIQNSASGNKGGVIIPWVGHSGDYPLHGELHLYANATTLASWQSYSYNMFYGASDSANVHKFHLALNESAVEVYVELKQNATFCWAPTASVSGVTYVNDRVDALPEGAVKLNNRVNATLPYWSLGSTSKPVYFKNGVATEATGVAAKTELEAKQDKLTAGDLITIANNVVSAANVLKPTDISNDPNKDFDNLPADNVLYYKRSSTDFANQPEHGAYRFIQWTSSDYYSIQIAIDGNNQFFARSSYRKTPSDTFKTWRPWIKLQEKLTFDETPTAGSTNPVTSGGIKAAIDAESTARSDADTALGSRISTLEGKTKLSDFMDDITTGTYSETGSAPVNGQAVASAVGAEATARSEADAALDGRIDTVDARGLTVKEIDGEQVLCFE